MIVTEHYKKKKDVLNTKESILFQMEWNVLFLLKIDFNFYLLDNYQEYINYTSPG